MLSKNDLQEIANIIDVRVSPLEKGMQTIQSDMHTLRSNMHTLQSDMQILKQDVKTIKRKVSKNEKTLDILIVRSDREETKLDKRVKKIEEHLHW